MYVLRLGRDFRDFSGYAGLRWADGKFSVTPRGLDRDLRFEMRIWGLGLGLGLVFPRWEEWEVRKLRTMWVPRGVTGGGEWDRCAGLGRSLTS